MSGAIPPLPQYAFMAWGLVKHRDNFTFTFFFLSERTMVPHFRSAAYGDHGCYSDHALCFQQNS
jgi:hypothetical protein